MNFVRTNNLSLKNKSFTSRVDIGVKKSEFVAETQFLSGKMWDTLLRFSL